MYDLSGESPVRNPRKAVENAPSVLVYVTRSRPSLENRGIKLLNDTEWVLNSRITKQTIELFSFTKSKHISRMCHYCPASQE